ARKNRRISYHRNTKRRGNLVRTRCAKYVVPGNFCCLLDSLPGYPVNFVRKDRSVREGRMNQLAQLNQQYIGGVWRDGRSQRVLHDSNPYNGKAIADFRLANLSDLDEAYRSAAAAQKVWAEVNPFEKRTILEKAITWIEGHEGDIADIIIEE